MKNQTLDQYVTLLFFLGQRGFKHESVSEQTRERLRRREKKIFDRERECLGFLLEPSDKSVDPKPQAKADLVTGVIFVYFLTV